MQSVLKLSRRNYLNTMEYRKYNTPRERIDDDMLERILKEENITCCSYGDRSGNSPISSQSRCQARSRVEARQENQRPNNPDGTPCNEGCGKDNCLADYPLAMAYTPDQKWQNLYSDDDSISHGTIFTELYKPFYYGCSGNCR